jgi:hypothetical protein
MNQAAFAEHGIMELNFVEVDLVCGAVDADDVITAGTIIGAGATIAAGVTGGPTNPVGAFFTAVAGVATITVGVAILVDED